jgi:hypothetical protein
MTPVGCNIANHEFPMHRCKAHDVFLYNGIKLWDVTKDAFSCDALSWQEMPVMTSVCPEYKPKKKEVRCER